jgi:hypothetical protein
MKILKVLAGVLLVIIGSLFVLNFLSDLILIKRGESVALSSLIVPLLIGITFIIVGTRLWGLKKKKTMKKGQEGRVSWSESVKSDILDALNSSDNLQVDWALSELAYYKTHGIKEAEMLLNNHDTKRK